MNAKHTPTPWAYGAHSQYSNAVTDANGRCICTVQATSPYPITPNPSELRYYDPTKADDDSVGRLIAAAPALLAFVERVSNTLRLDGTARNAALVTDAADLLRLARGS